MSSMITNYGPVADHPWSRSDHRDPYERKAPYENRNYDKSNTWFSGGLPTPPGTRAMTDVSVGTGISNYPSSHSYQSNNALQDVPTMSSNPYQHQQQHRLSQSSQSVTGSPQPSRSNGSVSYAVGTTEKGAGNLIASHLQIPESVNKSKGSLAEFAAEITCLFWFETAPTLQYAGSLPLDAFVDRGLVSDAVPSTGFRKWVTTILSTTQVGKNVILLALMFIYRLKKFNPSVSGKRGSEFRLLTIALMLGNKFLDDNTYTNKTWAEVSGISVTEIHIMEVEFLSNMRYDLYASESEWAEWKAKLGRFGSFYQKAAALPLVDETKSALPVTPTMQSFPNKLPSPPSTHHTSGPYIFPVSTQSAYAPLPNHIGTAPLLPHSPLRQQRIPSVDHLEHRKRSLDLSSEFPPTKRMHYPSHSGGSTAGILTPVSYSSTSSGSASVPPMHVPEATEVEGLRHQMSRMPVPNVLHGNQLAPLTLPVNRSMSSVYPNTSTTWSQPITPVSAIPNNLYQNPIPNLGNGSRPQGNLGSSNTSPTAYGTATSTLPGLSPSYFLTNRSSPYRPVRNVNTLLIPPPSAALQNSVRNLAQDQMHYQPLSKVATERRTGPVPFLYPDGYSHASTPLAQHYPYRA